MSLPIDLNNIQGDILDGLPKKGQTFFFFQILDPENFCIHLASLIPHIATAAQVQDDRTRILEEKARATHNHTTPVILDMSGINIAFSQKGLNQLSIGDDIGDLGYKQGMLEDAASLGDVVSKWQPEFTQDIHGVILVTGSSHPVIDDAVAKVKSVFHIGKQTASIIEVTTVVGHTRPGDISGHEHFGFADGISQPLVDGFVPAPPAPNRGQEVIAQGIILCGRDGDNGAIDPGKPVPGVQRPNWAVDGSFLCFRKLNQLVPEFNAFLQHPVEGASLNPDAADLLGARLVGRWKSGAPIDITGLLPETASQDDPVLGADASRNNAFRYDPNSQDRCPFAAHTRKTNPRDDLAAFGGTEIRRIIRRGIQFGPEVTAEEKHTQKTAHERGLLFVSYQSNLHNGFQFIQKSWANDTNFPPGKALPPVSPPILSPPGSGIDAIIGVGLDPATEDSTPRQLAGTDPSNATKQLSLTNIWVVSKGGEYFFSPSITALQNTFAQAA